MYPLLLDAPVKDYLWGGKKLKTDFGFKTEKEIAAEAWVLSCHKDGMNYISNGEYKDKTLSEVLSIWGKSALGKNAKRFSYFPILIKFIDAKQNLSVQVHPDDAYALENEGEYGKTEMWYVVDCDEGASLVYGFKNEISKEQFEEYIKNNTLSEVCNLVPVKKGDVFFISAGTLHAIGGGIVIAEVQQNSNTTYRVYDYGRVGADGNPRELHIEKALEVTKREAPTEPFGNIGAVTKINGNTLRKLAVCDKFSAEILSLSEPFEVYMKDSFVSLVVLDGEVNIEWDDERFKAQKGDSIFIPANLRVKLKGNAEILYSYI